MTDEIYKSFLATRKAAKAHRYYPQQAGIYAFFLTDGIRLPNFGQEEKLIYIGIAKDSMKDRDFEQHFRSGQSGRSTLRRSLGAILKNQLGLAAIPRGGANDSKRFDNYRFTEIGENALTNWMGNNLEVGYWVPGQVLPYSDLRDKEKEVTMRYLPILDLDRRTKKYNKYATKLDLLRKACKLETRSNG